MEKKLYNVLVVDDESTCLTILKAHLQKWNYKVTAVKHAYDALCTLRDKPYDLVLSDVHMPDMDGFELQRHINREFRLPVILISSDSRVEVICKGLQNGAQIFLVKPIVADDVKNIWQFSVLWKKCMSNGTPPIREINRSYQENVVRNIEVPSDNIVTAKTPKVVWTRDLHNRFVEALLVIGFHRAVPRNILEVMNVPELKREHVGSHLQKYKRFLFRILDGSADIESSHWIDLDFYSNSVSGNPHLMLINQLRDEQRTDKLAGRTPAISRSFLSGRCRPLPLFNPAEASSRRDTSAMWMPNNYASSSAKMTAEGFDSNANRGNIVGSSTILYPVQNQMGCFDQNTQVAPQNCAYRNGGLVGEANKNMFPSANYIGTSSFAPFPNNFYFNQTFNLGGQGSNNLFNGHDINGGQQLGGGEMTNKILFNGHNINGGERDSNTSISFGANQFGNTSAVNEQQLGAVQMKAQNFLDGQNIDGGQHDPITGISFGANQFGNTTVVNEPQLDGGEVTDQKRSNNNEVLSPDNSLLGGNLFQDEDDDDSWGDIMNLGIADDEIVGEEFWGDIMNVGIADDENIGVADEKEEYIDEDDENSGDDAEDDENSGDDDEEDDENSGDDEDDSDADYNPEEEC